MVRRNAVSGRLGAMHGAPETQKVRGTEALTEADSETETAHQPSPEPQEARSDKPREVGGPKGPEPTRFGDWERAGRCIDF